MTRESLIKKFKLQDDELGFSRVSPRFRPNEPIVMQPSENNTYVAKLDQSPIIDIKININDYPLIHEYASLCNRPWNEMAKIMFELGYEQFQNKN